jgi:hypothetical protein
MCLISMDSAAFRKMPSALSKNVASKFECSSTTLMADRDTA